MTTDFHALCAELVDELEGWIAYGDEIDIANAHVLIDRARVALAEPEPEDDELLSLDQLRDSWNAQADAANSWDDLGIDEIIWWTQLQAFARWGYPAPKPVDGEVAELVAWLRKTSRAAFMDGWPNEESINLTRAADLLERLRPPRPGAAR